MHFFWGGDMPHYSPPIPFQRGPSGVSKRAGQPGPGVLVVRAGWRAQARAPGLGRVRARWPEGPAPMPGAVGRGLARWLACPGPRPGSRPRTCALAGGPAPVPDGGVAPRFSPVCAPLLAEFFSFLTDISV